MSETDFKATPEQIARITETAVRKLAETHVIITKDELRDLMAQSVDIHTKELWELVLSTYRQTADQMTSVLTPEQLQGFELGADLLDRMHKVVLEEHSDVFDANHPEK